MAIFINKINIKQLVLSLVFLVLGMSIGFGISIRPLEERNNIIAEGNALIQVANPVEKTYFEGLEIPFIYIPENNDPAPLFTGSETDEEILQTIVDAHLPRGRVFRKGRFYLVFDSGMYTQGEFLKVDFGERRIRIRIDEITSEGYTLRFKEATVETKFSELIGKEKARDALKKIK